MALICSLPPPPRGYPFPNLKQRGCFSDGVGLIAIIAIIHIGLHSPTSSAAEKGLGLHRPGATNCPMQNWRCEGIVASVSADIPPEVAPRPPPTRRGPNATRELSAQRYRDPNRTMGRWDVFFEDLRPNVHPLTCTQHMHRWRLPPFRGPMNRCANPQRSALLRGTRTRPRCVCTVATSQTNGREHSHKCDGGHAAEAYPPPFSATRCRGGAIPSI